MAQTGKQDNRIQVIDVVSKLEDIAIDFARGHQDELASIIRDGIAEINRLRADVEHLMVNMRYEPRGEDSLGE